MFVTTSVVKIANKPAATFSLKLAKNFLSCSILRVDNLDSGNFFAVTTAAERLCASH